MGAHKICTGICDAEGNMREGETESKVGLLEIVCALAVLATVVASVVWGLNLLVTAVMLIAAYALLRDVRVSWRVKK